MAIRRLLKKFFSAATGAVDFRAPRERKAKRLGRQRHPELETLEDRHLLTCTAQACTDWMADLPDSVLLSEISIPGTHDTLTYAGPADFSPIPNRFSDTQDLSLTQQLDAGIRFWDIRLRKYMSNPFSDTKFQGYHGKAPQDVHFERVLLDAKAFLSAHPNETILMQIDTEEQKAVCLGFNGCDTDIDLMDEYLRERGGYPFLYVPPSNGGPPTLGDVRGKMVWFTRNWIWNNHFSHDIIKVQDPATYTESDELLAATRKHLTTWSDPGTSDSFYRMGMTGESIPTITPRNVADKINPVAEAYFTDAAGGPTISGDFPGGLRTTGIITMDFPEIAPQLIPAIVNLNEFFCVDCPIPDVHRVNIGGRIPASNPSWAADGAVNGHVNNTNFSTSVTALCGLENTDNVVAENYASRVEPTTPNVNLRWSSHPDGGKWEEFRGWPNDPGCGVYQLEDTDTHVIDFTPDPGWNVAIESFDLNVHPDGDAQERTRWTVRGSQSGVIASNEVTIDDNSTSTIAVNVTGVNGEVLSLDLTNLAGGDDLAMDNLKFSQVELPSSKHPSIPDGTPMDLFLTERWDPAGGEEMQFDFPVIPGDYEVRLYFADNYIREPGNRVFDVWVDGQLVLDDYDIVAKSGGFHKGVAETFPVSNTDGNLDIDFIHVIENPAISGIEIIRKVTPSEFHWINAGGPALVGNPTWAEDSSDSPSSLQTGSFDTFASNTNQIDMSDSSVPAETPPQLFQSERWDRADDADMEWDFPVVPGNYQVSLYFSEIFYDSVGARTFDVSIEGIQFLDNYDIVADVGANKGVVKTFVVASDGNLDIDFGRETDSPKVAGIKISPVEDLGTASIELARSSYMVGEDITVAFESPNFDAKDWVSIQPAGSDDVRIWNFIPSASGSLTFAGGISEPGQYTAYLYCCDGRDVYALVDFEVVADVIPSDKTDVTNPSDTVLLVSGTSDDDEAGDPPNAEGVSSAIDGLTDKYLNFKDLNSGLIVTPSAGSTIIDGLRIYTANDGVERDPASFLLEGSNNGAAGPFTTIRQSNLALPTQRNASGTAIDGTQWHQEVTFPNGTSYSTYRLTFPTLRDVNAANSMQVGEIEFLGIVDEAASIPGDIDNNGTVGFSDFLILSSNFGQDVVPGTGGDIDGNGNVAFADFLVLSGNFGKSVGRAESTAQLAAIDQVWARDVDGSANDDAADNEPDDVNLFEE